MTSTSIKDIAETLGSNGAAVNSLLSYISNSIGDEYTTFIPGDTFAFPGLEPNPGLQFVMAKAETMPSRDDSNDSEDEHDACIEITLHAYKSSYRSDFDSQKTMWKDVKAWLLNNRNEDKVKFLSQGITKLETTFYELKVKMAFESWYLLGDGVIGDVVDSPFYHNFWNVLMETIITEGVCYASNKVPNDLKNILRSQIDEMGKKIPVDFHPKSNDVIRDFVHPALYPYIKGVSKLRKNTKVPDKEILNEQFDFWGRMYEDSNFQWLPTPFKITEDRKCEIQSYINNLDKEMFPEFYLALENLFEIFLPYFEEVWSYCKAVEFFKGENANDDDDDDDLGEIPPLAKEKVSFNGEELQVIVKVVEYTLQPNQSYEGVWHAEGMSHENIVMTGIYFLDRSSSITGGDLRFKRAFTVAERSKVFWNIPQSRPVVLNTFASEGFIPLGHFPTSEGYLLVFPNCHIHKISKMINTHQKEVGSRRIVVFFFVNPEKKLVSTREIPPQQDSMSLKIAKDFRLELMTERKYDKEKLNVRDIELCEH